MQDMTSAFDDVGAPTKPALVVFFVIDRSGSMGGARINAVNTAMRETVPILRGMSGVDADFKIAVLTFSAGAKWMYSEPKDVESFDWQELDVEGWTDFGAACNELCNKMSRSVYMNSNQGYKKPIVILITDGGPTDDGVWQPALAKLKTNRWFQFAFKFALAVDESVDRDVLEDFVGTSEAVFDIKDPEVLKRLITVIAVTSSEIGSRSMPIDVSSSAGAGGASADAKDTQRVNKAVAAAAANLVPDSAWD